MKPGALIPLALVLALLLGGCGGNKGIYANYRAIEDLQTVQTLGLDPDDATGGVAVTAAVDKAGEETPTVLRRSGDSILLALRSLQDYADRGQLFFAHTRYVLLGQAQAEAGFGPLLDYTERDLLIRMGAALFVLRDTTAQSLLEEVGDGQRVLTMLDSVRRDTELWGGSHVTDLRSTAVALSDYGAALVCALAARPTEGSVFTDGPERTLVPDGYAIVKDGALVGFLRGTGAEAADFLLGYPGAVARCLPVEGGGTVTMELQCAGADYTPVWEDGTLVMDIRLSLKAVLCEADGVSAPLTDGAVPRALEAEVSAQTAQALEAVLAQSQALDADFLALGRQLRLRNQPLPEGDWLSRAQFCVHVDTVIDHSNDLGEPLPTGGQDR